MQHWWHPPEGREVAPTVRTVSLAAAGSVPLRECHGRYRSPRRNRALSGRAAGHADEDSYSTCRFVPTRPRACTTTAREPSCTACSWRPWPAAHGVGRLERWHEPGGDPRAKASGWASSCLRCCAKEGSGRRPRRPGVCRTLPPGNGAPQVQAQCLGQQLARATASMTAPRCGSTTNTECQIDSIAQSWSVSGAGEPEPARTAIEVVGPAPPRPPRSPAGAVVGSGIRQGRPEPGYIKGYLPCGQQRAVHPFRHLGHHGVRTPGPPFGIINPVNNNGNQFIRWSPTWWRPDVYTFVAPYRARRFEPGTRAPRGGCTA